MADSSDLNYSQLTKKTLYIRPAQSQALSLMALVEGRNEYEIVVAALDNFIPEKYFKLLKET